MSDIDKVKKLREATGAGFKDCNLAIKESNGNLDKAVEILRVKGISKASKKMSRDAKEGVVAISGDEQNWEDGYLYPILPSLNKSGIFDESVNVDTSYGNSNASITNVNDRDENIILNVDFDQTTTDDLSDKTNLSKVEYNQDFELSLDEDLRLKIEGLIIPDGIEKNKNDLIYIDYI